MYSSFDRQQVIRQIASNMIDTGEITQDNIDSKILDLEKLSDSLLLLYLVETHQARELISQATDLIKA